MPPPQKDLSVNGLDLHSPSVRNRDLYRQQNCTNPDKHTYACTEISEIKWQEKIFKRPMCRIKVENQFPTRPSSQNTSPQQEAGETAVASSVMDESVRSVVTSAWEPSFQTQAKTPNPGEAAWCLKSIGGMSSSCERHPDSATSRSLRDSWGERVSTETDHISSEGTKPCFLLRSSRSVWLVKTNCSGGLSVNLTQDKVIWKEGTVIEKNASKRSGCKSFS